MVAQPDPQIHNEISEVKPVKKHIILQPAEKESLNFQQNYDSNYYIFNSSFLFINSIRE